MNQIIETAIVICSIGLAVLLFYVAYYCCKRYATDTESVDIQDYVGNPSSNIFKERLCFSASIFTIRQWKYLIAQYNKDMQNDSIDMQNSDTKFSYFAFSF